MSTLLNLSCHELIDTIDFYSADTRDGITNNIAALARSLRLHASDPCCKNLCPDMVITDLAQLADVL